VIFTELSRKYLEKLRYNIKNGIFMFNMGISGKIWEFQVKYGNFR